MIKKMKSSFAGNKILKAAGGGIIAFSLVALMVTAVYADSIGAFDFESPAYSVGNINGQDGWSKTGPYDVEVASVASFGNAAGFGFGVQALRFSNAVTSGSFGDQAISPGLLNPANETDPTHFEASFVIGSTQSTLQSGLSVSISPDDGSGSRMSYVRFDDQSDGIHVTFYDATNPGPLNTGVTSWNGTDVVTIDRTSAHTVKFEIDLVPGPANDIVKLYVDGTLEITGTTWEDYYKYDPEQNGNGNVVPSISNLIIPIRGTAAIGTLGNGYLIDSVALESSTPVTRYAEITAPLAGDPAFSGLVDFAAFLTDDDADYVDWAVRYGTCAAGTNTVFGNVDGHSDSATIDQSDLANQTFAFSGDMSTMDSGQYCFIYNPREDSGEAKIRETVEFDVVKATPTDVNECKKDEWQEWLNPEFKNQGECVSYLMSNENAGKRD